VTTDTGLVVDELHANDRNALSNILCALLLLYSCFNFFLDFVQFGIIKMTVMSYRRFRFILLYLSCANRLSSRNSANWNIELASGEF